MKKLCTCLVVLAVLMALLLPTALAAESHPGMTTITSGRGVGDGSYINHDSSKYPFHMTFQLDEETIPLQSCRLGVYSWDCDEISSTWHYEYDMVFVNGTFVGVLTGQNSTWKTSYFDVPLSALKLGENEITIYVGHKEKSSGAIVQNTDYWLLTVNWASLQYDGGVSMNAPETFQLSLEYAAETENGIQCGAKAYIVSETVRSYVIEYSLVDKTDPSSPTYGQIIGHDQEQLSGTVLYSTGFFNLGEVPKTGSYVIQCTLRDPSTHEVYDYEELTFDMGEALTGGCEHKPAQENTLVRTAYRQLGMNDPDKDTQHEQQDIYWNICTECLETYQIYNGWERGTHTLPVCACGYVEPGYNPIQSAEIAPVTDPYTGSDHVITVITDENVAHLEAVNNHGYPLNVVWTRTEMGDGTVRWTAVYQPSTPAAERYWTITAYNVNSRAMSTANTNTITIKDGEGSLPENPDETTATYTIRVLDKKNAQPIAGATVQLCGQVLNTDADGNAVFDYDKLGKFGLHVSKTGSNYREVDKPDYTPGRKGDMYIIQLSDEKFDFTKAECNNKDVLGESTQINTNADLYARFELKYEVSNDAKINNYKIMQNGVVLGEDKNGKINIYNNKFTVGVPVVAAVDVTYNSGMSNTVEQPLVISVVAFGPDILPNALVNILDRFSMGSLDAEKSKKDDFLGKLANKLIGDKKSWSPALQIQYSVDNEKVSIGLGVELEDDIETKTAKKVSKALKAKDIDGDFGWSVTPAFAVNAKYTPPGWQSITGSLGIAGAVAAEFDIPTPIACTIEIEAQAGGSGMVDDLGWNLQKKTIDPPALKFTIGGDLVISAGFGLDLFGVEAKLGPYGKMLLEFLFGYDWDEGTGGLSQLTLGGEIGLMAEVEVGPFEYEGYFRILPMDEGGGKIEIPIGGRMPLGNTTLAAAFRSQRKSASNAAVVSDVSFNDNPAEADAAAMPAHLDEDAEPQLASAGDVTMMVYLDKDGDAADQANTTHLVYSLWNGSAWDAPVRIAESDLADGPFRLYSDGKDIYLTWIQLNRLLENSEMPNFAASESEVVEKLYKGLNHFDVFVAKYVPGEGFQSLGRLTEDEVYDFSADLTLVNGLPAVTYVKSADTASVADRNSLHLACMNADGQWTTTTLTENSLGLSGARIGLLDNKLCVAAVQETQDNNVYNILLWEEGGAAKVIATGLCASPVFGEVAGQQVLVWYENGAVMQLTSASGAPSALIAGGAGTDLALYPTGIGTVLTFTGLNGSGAAELYGMVLGGQAAPVVLLTDAALIFAYDALPLPDGLYVAWRSTQVSSGSSASTMQGRYVPFGAALTDAMITYDESEVLSGNTLMVDAYLYNGGMKAISAVKVMVDGAEVATIECGIPSGEWGEAAFPVQLPAEMKGSISLAFQAEGTSAVTLPITIALERLDFAILAEDVYLADKEYLKYSVQNVGTVDGYVTLLVQANDADGEILYSKSFDLAAQHVVNDIVDVSELLGKTAMRTLWVELVSGAEESALSDNTVPVYFPEF